MFTAPGQSGYVAEKAETEAGWLFPVGDEVHELGYVNMFTDMFNAMEAGTKPREDFYDGYVVNAVMDACFASAKSKKWEPVNLEVWRGEGEVKKVKSSGREHAGKMLIKEEHMPDGRMKRILKDKQTGEITEMVS